MESRGLGKTGDEPHNYVLMFLSNMEDEGLSLLPTHRIVEIDSDIHIKETLTKHFNLQKIDAGDSGDEEARRQMLKAMECNEHSFGMYLTNTGSYYTMSLNNAELALDLPACLRTLDVSVLHKFVFEDLLNITHYEYEMDPAIAVQRAQKGSFDAVFFLNPTKIKY